MKKPLNNPSPGRPVALDTGYTSGCFATRVVYVGGMSKQQILGLLAKSKVELNEYAHTLFSNDKFTTLASRQPVTAVEIAVAEFGFTTGATTQEVRGKAAALGLRPPPLELGPHLRLQYLDQPEGYWGHPVTSHRAPPGSIVVASAPLSDDDKFPKGFYLRRIKGIPWLRGYCASEDHMNDPDVRFIFCQP